MRLPPTIRAISARQFKTMGEFVRAVAAEACRLQREADCDVVNVAAEYELLREPLVVAPDGRRRKRATACLGGCDTPLPANGPEFCVMCMEHMMESD